MDRLRRFQSLCGRDRWLVVQAMVLLPLTALALRLVGFQRCKATLCRWVPKLKAGSADRPDASIEQARQVARMVQAASRHGLRRANCLEQSLVLWWMLLRRGVPAGLRIGVRKAEGCMRAHAWVELGGVVLNDAEDVLQRYAPFEQDIVAMSVEER